MLKARILPNADASDARDAWSDNQIAAALETSIDTVARPRQQLVEWDIGAALTRQHSPNSCRGRIFDEAAEAIIIALTPSPPPKRAQALDAEAAGECLGRTQHRRPRQRQHDQPHQTRSSRI